MTCTAYQSVPRCPECGAYMQHGSGNWQCWDWECMISRLRNIKLPDVSPLNAGEWDLPELPVIDWHVLWP